MTVQLVVPDPNVGAHRAVAQLHITHAALEAVDVVEQTETLDYHGRAPTCDQRGLMLGSRLIMKPNHWGAVRNYIKEGKDQTNHGN